MKRIILALVACTMLAGCAGFKQLESKDMELQRVVEVPKVSKSILFDRSRMWYASAFARANSVIQYENKENGTIMGNGVVSDSIGMVPHYLKFAVATESKDGKSRIKITGQSYSAAGPGDFPVQARIWNNFNGQLTELMDSYEQYLKSSDTKTDNW